MTKIDWWIVCGVSFIGYMLVIIVLSVLEEWPTAAREPTIVGKHYVWRAR